MFSQPAPKIHKTYLTWMSFVWIFLCLSVLSINWLVDPLWFSQGNLVTGKNFAFNERQAKINQFMRNLHQYDCIIFGSSRTTLLPATAFSLHHCFNLSFSGGQIEEFIAFAEYLHHFGIQPKTIIIGVDGFNFVDFRDPLDIPIYIKEKKPPVGILKTYLSIDSLLMSWRTLRDKSPLPRYYDNQFEALIRPDAPTYRPEKLDAEGLSRVDAEERRKRQFRPERANLYKELADVFKGADIIAYVPPISTWHIAAMNKNGVLESYIQAIYATSKYFTTFIDYSVPSVITRRIDNTYDGSHYTPTVNRLIVQELCTENFDWGLNVSNLTYDEYQQHYRQALEKAEIYLSQKIEVPRP